MQYKLYTCTESEIMPKQTNTGYQSKHITKMNTTARKYSHVDVQIKIEDEVNKNEMIIFPQSHTPKNHCF